MPQVVDLSGEDVVDPVQLVALRVRRLQGAESIFYGLDVGRVKDYSALSILVRYVYPLTGDYGQIVYGYRCVHLERFPLNTEYEVIEASSERWWSWADAEGYRRHFLMDMTGVGAPVLEGIRKRRVRAKGINITGGNEATERPDGSGWNVPRTTLITRFVDLVQRNRLTGDAALPNWELLKEEMRTLKYKQDTETGAVKYETAGEREHDDLVMAVAIPLWYAEKVVPYRQTVTGRGPEVDEPYHPLGKR